MGRVAPGGRGHALGKRDRRSIGFSQAGKSSSPTVYTTRLGDDSTNQLYWVPLLSFCQISSPSYPARASGDDSHDTPRVVDPVTPTQFLASSDGPGTSLKASRPTPSSGEVKKSSEVIEDSLCSAPTIRYLPLIRWRMHRAPSACTAPTRNAQ